MAERVRLRPSRAALDRHVGFVAGELFGDGLYVQCLRGQGSTVESKITIATSGRAAILRECRVSGAEAQRSSLSEAAATQAGDTPRATKGTPDSAGRAGHECALHAISVLRGHFRRFLGR